MSVRRLLVAACLATVVGLTTGATVVPAGTAATGNVVTPGSFRGYGFDQCLAPTQRAMNVWLKKSPFLAVGIYISGASRACRSQPNLTPTWVSTQLRKGWKLLPITLGPQAPCNPRFPRYGNDPVI
ncbi:MAG TPA: glycoside hydrolase domain-containing protein, partial [Streptosporangiaceae bacterium]|nr:glycoside hydrolase domain-containing protein [Streptosporangiaceae bacterium]